MATPCLFTFYVIFLTKGMLQEKVRGRGGQTPSPPDVTCLKKEIRRMSFTIYVIFHNYVMSTHMSLLKF